MSQTTSPLEQIAASNAQAWVQYHPDGAVSIEIEDSTLVLRASQKLQERFETFLARRKAGTSSPEETREYAAICDLDTALSWLNRLIRSARNEASMAVSPATRRIVRERAQRRCEYCHADERWQFVRFTIDHVLPQSAGSSDDADNLALACRNCNERRGNHLTGPRSRDAGGRSTLQSTPQ